MKITERTQIAIPKSRLEAFSQRQFTLELDGFQLLALNYIAGKIGGAGKTRRVFSDGGKDVITTQISEVDGVYRAMEEFKKFVTVEDKRCTIYVNDRLN